MPVADPRVVVMAKYPTAGSVKTRLAAAIGPEHAARLSEAFVHDLAARLGDAGIVPVWAYWPPEAPFQDLVPGSTVVAQRGTDLGARMAGAAGDVLADGAAGAILLGADVPHVDLGAVRAACRFLREGTDVVLGPTDDGGYYLLGLSRVRPELFGGMPWGGDTVFAETLARCAALGVKPQIVSTTFDVDGPSDLARLAALLASGAIVLPHTRAALARAGLS